MGGLILNTSHLAPDEFTTIREYPPVMEEFPSAAEAQSPPPEFAYQEAESSESSPRPSTMRRMQKMLAMLCAAGISIGVSVPFFGVDTTPAEEPSAPVIELETFEEESSEDFSLFDLLPDAPYAPVEEDPDTPAALDLSFALPSLHAFRDALLTDNLLSFMDYSYQPPSEITDLLLLCPEDHTFVLTSDGVFSASSEYSGEILLVLYLDTEKDEEHSADTALTILAVSADAYAPGTAPGNAHFIYAGGGEILSLSGVLDETLSSDNASFVRLVGEPSMWLISEETSGFLSGGVFTGTVASSFYQDWGTGTGAAASIPEAAGTITFDLNEEGRLDVSALDLISDEADRNAAVLEDGYRYYEQDGYLYVNIALSDPSPFASFRSYKLENGLTKVIFDTGLLQPLFDLYS